MGLESFEKKMAAVQTKISAKKDELKKLEQQYNKLKEDYNKEAGLILTSQIKGIHLDADDIQAITDLLKSRKGLKTSNTGGKKKSADKPKSESVDEVQNEEKQPEATSEVKEEKAEEIHEEPKQESDAQDEFGVTSENPTPVPEAPPQPKISSIGNRFTPPPRKQ